MPLRSVDWVDGAIKIIDQNRLPDELVYNELTRLEEVVEAIETMKVRGAPLIGVVAALGLGLIANQSRSLPRDQVIKRLRGAALRLKETRPTAVNLSWAVEKMLALAEASYEPAEALVREGVKMMEEDVRVNREMASMGESLIDDGDVVLTHCNSGSLAAVSTGTAQGVLLIAHKTGRMFRVYATETRPKMQGSRLTAFELMHESVDVVIIPDTAAGHTMKTKGVSKVFLGADRILRDGTTYNKIGTYQIAVLAKTLGIPFYVVAPTSTLDLRSTREDVTIEERPALEVTHIKGVRIAPEGVEVFNPAFDETPPDLITAIVTEKGILRPPFTESIGHLFEAH